VLESITLLGDYWGSNTLLVVFPFIGVTNRMDGRGKSKRAGRKNYLGTLRDLGDRSVSSRRKGLPQRGFNLFTRLRVERPVRQEVVDGLSPDFCRPSHASDVATRHDRLAQLIIGSIIVRGARCTVSDA
jgi:hypothetical protein